MGSLPDLAMLERRPSHQDPLDRLLRAVDEERGPLGHSAGMQPL